MRPACLLGAPVRSDALSALADAGWAGVALALGPGAGLSPHDAQQLRHRCDRVGLAVTVVLAAPARSAGDAPTLTTASPEGRDRWLRYARWAADLAQALQAEALTVDTGVPDGVVDRPAAWRWARDGVGALLDSHGGRGTSLAALPVPGTLLRHADDWQRLQAAVPQVALAVDAAHCREAGPYPAPAAARVFAPHLGSVRVRPDEPDLGALLAALADTGYAGLVTVDPGPGAADAALRTVQAAAQP